MEIKWIPKEGRRGVFSLIVDEDPFRDIHASIFGRSPELSKCRSLGELETLLDVLEYKGAKNYALKRLSIKSQPSTEMEKALKERLVSEKNRSRVIEEFVSLGYLNDNEWIERFIRLQTLKKQGPKTIFQKLKAKGLNDDQIIPILEDHTSPESQQEQITALLNGKYKSRDTTDYNQKQKVIASLLRKGFEFEQILKAIDLRKNI